MGSKLFLSWGDFDLAVAVIAARAPADFFDDIYGIPRGGLPLAVALSHETSKPLARMIGPRTLVVDDVAESGATFRLAVPGHHPPALIWAWVVKRARDDVNYVLHAPADAWVVFPWESAARAAGDVIEYRARRT